MLTSYDCIIPQCGILVNPYSGLFCDYFQGYRRGLPTMSSDLNQGCRRASWIPRAMIGTTIMASAKAAIRLSIVVVVIVVSLLLFVCFYYTYIIGSCQDHS